jgi:hypothetical protein
MASTGAIDSGDDACFHDPLYSPLGTPTYLPTPMPDSLMSLPETGVER